MFDPSLAIPPYSAGGLVCKVQGSQDKRKQHIIQSKHQQVSNLGDILIDWRLIEDQ